MKLAVIGSRGFEDYSLLSQKLDEINPSEIISGGAKGADTLADRYANEHDIKLTEFKPDYKKYGRGAPHVRNRQIVDASEKVLAFWDGKSRGTLSTLKYAEKQSIEIEKIIFS